MKMCQVVIRQCEGFTQHKPEVVDYYEPFRDFLHQILKVYAPKRMFWRNYNYFGLIVKVLLTFGLHAFFIEFCKRTSDGGNGNHSVSLPIILIKIKVCQMIPSSYISSLLVSILWFCIWFPISMNVRLYYGAKMVTFCIIHIGNRKIFLKHHSPPSSN